jgi:hypothetical protein
VNEFNTDSTGNLNQFSATNRKTPRVIDFLGTNKNNNPIANQAPILANISLSNPFYENSFPVCIYVIF